MSLDPRAPGIRPMKHEGLKARVKLSSAKGELMYINWVGGMAIGNPFH